MPYYIASKANGERRVSISNFQEKIFKGGCGISILVALAGVMLTSMFYGACAGDRNPAANQGDVKIAFTVGSTPVRADVVTMGMQEQIQQTNQQFGGMADMLPPTFQAQAAGRAISILIDTAAFLPIAEKNGIKLDDASLLAASKQEFEDTKQSVRSAYIQQGLIKPTATDAEFSDAVKKKEGRSIAEIEKERNENLQKSLQDPAKKEDLRISLARTALVQGLMAKLKVTDDEVKKSFETVSYKKIILKSGMPGGTPQVRAEAVLKALKGGMKFEAAMDKFSNEVPPAKQKLSTMAAATTGGAALESDPTLSPLKTLEAGKYSDVVDIPDGKAIYYVVTRDPNLPKDFATAIENYRRSVARQKVTADIDKQLTEFKKQSGAIKWNSLGIQALYEYSMAPGTSPFGGGSVDVPKMQEILSLAEKALEKSQGYDVEAASMAQFGAIEALYLAPGADQAKLRPKRIAAIEKLLETTESFRLRMDLVDLFLESKDNAKAADQLLLAAQYNTALDDSGKQRYDQVFQKLTTMRAQNQLTTDQAKSVVAELDRWKKDKAENDRLEAEAKKAAGSEQKTAPKTGGQ